MDTRTLPKVRWMVKSVNGFYLSDRGGAWAPTPKDAKKYDRPLDAVAAAERMANTLERLSLTKSRPVFTVVPFEEFTK